MCGIAGVVGGTRLDAALLTAMSGALLHRGPDDGGVWVDADAAIGFGHRRLSIVDLSPAGHQPMTSPSGRYVITYNGEIYNHGQLREQLNEASPLSWRGHSDTETLLAGFDVWGVQETLRRSNGMFAFGLWDRQERTLTLARDRLGEKPLYYGWARGRGGAFLFASELKALHQHPDFNPVIDRNALGLLVRYLDVPAPFSIFKDVFKVLPGTTLTLRPGELEPAVAAYWSGADVAREGVAKPLEMNQAEAINGLEHVLEQAVGRQMMADVPLGAFLSGGVDSSTVVATMQKLSARPVKTFTIGFHEKGYNEAQHAKEVARHLGTDHTELYVTPAQAMDVIPQFSSMYDEPFADSSQIPTHLISKLAREHVTVALSGDGGDELFGGYDRYLLTAKLWQRIADVPVPLRTAAARAITALPSGAWTGLGDVAGKLLPGGMRLNRLGDKVHKGASMLGSRTLEDLYDSMLSLWRDPSVVVKGGGGPQPVVSEDVKLEDFSDVEWMMAQDMLGYLPDDILAKVDRAAMSVSLETRVPLLDREVVEFAWRVPLDYKIRGSTTKWLLRQVLYRHVPAKLIDRPKMGFGIPLDSWLRGPLRDWAEDLLDERRLSEDGYFHAAQVRQTWAEHLAGRNNQFKLWTVLMFQSWLKNPTTLH